MEKVEITIIGAGVIGLAVAALLSERYKDIFIVEKEPLFGQGASSRNSEVIHAGIYYPTQSLKAKTCLEGNRILYELCAKNNIPCKQIQKLIVATCSAEENQIEQLYRQGSANGVRGLKIIDAQSVNKMEPNIKALSALLSPTTGIIDSHKLMEFFSRNAKNNGAFIAYKTTVQGIEKKNGYYDVTALDAGKEKFVFSSKAVINAAGLCSDSIANLVGLDTEKLGYNLNYCKGEYFRLVPNKCSMVERLIYPVPAQSGAGLGIHLTPDISGQVRLGPDAQYMKERSENYDITDACRKYFYESVKEFAPFIEETDIYPDMSGIRPKLQGPGEDFRDFVIREESENGFPGFINLIGIESPGLTAAPAIAKYVENLLKIYKN